MSICSEAGPKAKERGRTSVQWVRDGNSGTEVDKELHSRVRQLSSEACYAHVKMRVVILNS